ncbi:NAD(P)/FAD-dependent oxidoreductase [Flavobacterium jejuense]|uniref:NAD(P)/FAD-dependent oxidoreductase n=1 Tax=Flavobacterium jejuense TaxID=1544455 RepID=A0ABX0IQD9_9FLAO|nr:NAD(P)/FAD-dependent oxidoreductase [Flavobacterium jejuense]NHN25791.1 NAD(P)/FAD-dependent oxidoreductase [Flavobacterium jejuense]
MNNQTKIGIIGGGLAGLTAAIHLLKQGFFVILFEKNSFPKHKVCGEFISNEVWEYLHFLNLNIESLQPTKINRTVFSTQDGKTIGSQLPLGGFGVSRYALDNHLHKNVIALGGVIIQTNVTDVTFSNDIFTIKTEENQDYTFKIALGAFGKRSNLDIRLGRRFIKKKSPWLAVKAHYQIDFPNDLVALHNFEGGYCGISKVENDAVNVCYLVQYKSFKNYKDITVFHEQVMSKNPNLKTLFVNGKLLFEKPLTISQISFENKPKIENHMLMIGDSAGLIHPLCGNGMAMAIHSAKIASELVILYLENVINRKQLEIQYVSDWNKTFKNRLRFGKIVSKIVLNFYLSKIIMRNLLIFPFLFPMIIKKTHGKSINKKTNRKL